MIFLWVWLNTEETLQALSDKTSITKVAVTQPVIDQSETPAPGLKEKPDSARQAKGQDMARIMTPPVAGLHVIGQDGHTLPIIRDDGLTAFEAYRKPFTLGAKPDKLIGIAVIHFGLSDEVSQMLLDALPPSVSLILSPYSTAPQEWINRAHEAGHEVWLELPLEPLDFPASEPGPHTLLINASLEEKQDKLSWIMGRATGYAGLASVHRSKLIYSGTDLDYLVSRVYEHGLGLAIANTDATFETKDIIEDKAGPFVQNTIWLDTPPLNGHINNQLTAIDNMKSGPVVAMMHPLPVTIEAVTNWIDTLERKGYQLTPISYMARATDAPQKPAEDLRAPILPGPN